MFSLFLSLFCYLTDSSPPSSPPTSQGPSTSTSLGYHPLTSGSIKTTSTLCKLPQWLFNSQVPCWNTYKVFLLFWNTVISLLFWNTSRQNIAKKKYRKVQRTLHMVSFYDDILYKTRKLFFTHVFAKHQDFTHVFASTRISPVFLQAPCTFLNQISHFRLI